MDSNVSNVLGALAKSRPVDDTSPDRGGGASDDPFALEGACDALPGASASSAQKRSQPALSGSERKRRRRSTKDDMTKLLKQVGRWTGEP